MTEFRLKRIYDPPAPDDDLRVLVDRLWPRGVKRAEAQIDVWLKEIAPSAELRKWYGHDREKWPEFRGRYSAELKNGPARRHLEELAKRRRVTLLYAAADRERNNAVVLKEFYESQ